MYVCLATGSDLFLKYTILSKNMSNEDICLFCLEEDKPDDPVMLLDFALEKECPCNCRIHIHISCWLYYFRAKNGFECPICHSRNDIIQQRPVEVPVIVTNPIHIMIPNEIQPFRADIGYRPFCYFCIIFVIVFLAALIYRVTNR
jgi:hypothetical protein